MYNLNCIAILYTLLQYSNINTYKCILKTFTMALEFINVKIYRNIIQEIYILLKVMIVTCYTVLYTYIAVLYCSLAV